MTNPRYRAKEYDPSLPDTRRSIVFSKRPAISSNNKRSKTHNNFNIRSIKARTYRVARNRHLVPLFPSKPLFQFFP